MKGYWCNIAVVNKYSMETFHIDTLKEDLFEVISRLSNEKKTFYVNLMLDELCKDSMYFEKRERQW